MKETTTNKVLGESESKVTSIRVDPKLWKRFNVHCAERDLDKLGALNAALDLYLTQPAVGMDLTGTSTAPLTGSLAPSAELAPIRTLRHGEIGDNGITVATDTQAQRALTGLLASDLRPVVMALLSALSNLLRSTGTGDVPNHAATEAVKNALRSAGSVTSLRNKRDELAEKIKRERVRTPADPRNPERERSGTRRHCAGDPDFTGGSGV